MARSGHFTRVFYTSGVGWPQTSISVARLAIRKARDDLVHDLRRTVLARRPRHILLIGDIHGLETAVLVLQHRTRTTCLGVDVPASRAQQRLVATVALEMATRRFRSLGLTAHDIVLQEYVVALLTQT